MNASADDATTIKDEEKASQRQEETTHQARANNE